MPCFQGLAVSIHTPDGPLPEYHIQKQARMHRITSYIPVPPPKVSSDTTTAKAEQSTFAISITLLTPGLNVPYSTPKPTAEDPHPRPKIVSGLPEYGGQRGKFGPVIGPYVPLTASPNETIAAYIYFDGRAKEEVATLLRRGEETWVNSRWVSVPESEGGGLAEREFIFREVGLERWLNGLDLEGSTQEVAKRIERRRQKFEKKHRERREAIGSGDDDDDDGVKRKPLDRNGVLRYGEDKNAPVEALSDSGSLSSDLGSDDEEPMPEAAGQIKVALFRVIASGEIKKGEYSPQFDVHDDEDDATGNSGGSGAADVDHTTSFAKPKTLDPKSISTQTVTGIDPPDKPYAVFTFFYRGERQLRKMGILPGSQQVKTPTPAKRKSAQIDFSSLTPLTSEKGTKNFVGYRDPSASTKIKKKGKDGEDDAMDSDIEDDDDDDDEDNTSTSVLRDADEAEAKDANGNSLLSPEDALKQEALTEGVRKIKLKRQHSAEPLDAPSPAGQNRSPSVSTPTSAEPPAAVSMNGANASSSAASAAASAVPASVTSDSVIGSPFKKQRASMSGIDESVRKPAIDSDAPRRESESAAVVASVSGLGVSVWPAGRTQAEPIKKLDLGPELKPQPDQAMQEDEEL